MAIPHKLVSELLALPEEERGALAALLLRSLESDEGGEVFGQEWDAAWAAEIQRRVKDVEGGSAELVDGEQVDAEIRAMLDATP